MTWEQLGSEVGFNLNGRTIKNAMGTIGYRQCIACRKGWASRPVKEKRIEHARIMLERYSVWQDCIPVRFNDNVHFGYGPQGRVYIIRKPGTRYCPEHIQHADPPMDKDKKRFHCWAAVEYDFKSDITFYDVPGNTNDKMTQQVYIDQILEPVVKPWIESGQHFVLEEDGDSGHGPGKSNIVRTWKEQHGLKHYFNCASSPDLSPIENC